MMYGNGLGWVWMMLMPLTGIALIAIIVWAVVWAARRPVDSPPAPPRETPQEILDRRLALGEIDPGAYAEARARLAGRDEGKV